MRAPEKSDFSVYREFYGDAAASKFYGGPKSESESWDKLAGDLGHWHLRGYGLWALRTKTDNQTVGACGLVWPHGWQRPELTWWIASNARRKGFAREASVAAIRFGYQQLKWDLVQTYMKDENEAARALVLSLGGTKIARETFPDGLDRDVYRLPQ